MGIVYRARDLVLDTAAAVKVLSPVLAQDPNSTEKLKEEARVAHLLGHPNIVQLRNFEEDGRAKYLVMEFVEGKNLRQVMADRGRLPVDEVLALAQGMCAGLDYAHSQGVVHRDLKPENFLVSADGVVKIADFGLAKVASDLLGPATQVVLAGTPAYMSPEQFRGDKVDARTDVFSLGMTLYELLSGSDGITPQKLHQLILRDAVPDIPDVPRHVNRALKRAVAPDRAQRLKAAGELLQALQAPIPEPRAAAPLSSFFGRQEELARLEEMLLQEGRRLVTITGPGGCGKTRLAQEACARLGRAFADTVWHVPLQDIEDPQLIPDAILGAMGLTPEENRTALSLATDALSIRPCLVVLDNFEHLVDGGASVVRQLLESAPGLVCLIASRQLLRLRGERRLDVGPLPVPSGDAGADDPADSPSVQLFVDRAQAVRPSFRLTEANGPVVGDICRRLDGIPLAIELAAARSQVMDPAQMLESLASPLDFLVSRTRDVAARHRTLRAAIEWSCRQLSPVQQSFFAGLSAFRGGWVTVAARTVCEDALALDHLAHLCECSLILADDSGEQVRFRMLDTLRAYAAEQLSADEQADVRRRHAQYYLAFAEQPEAPADRIARLAEEQENVRSAIAWFMATEERGEEALRFAAALGDYWLKQGLWREGSEHLRRALANTDPAAHTRIRARALSYAGGLASGEGDYEESRRIFEASLVIHRELEDMQQVAETCGHLGNVLWRTGDPSGARALQEEALATGRQLGDNASVAVALHNLGLVAVADGDYDGSDQFFQESLAMRKALGDEHGVAESMSDLGLNALDTGDHDKARELLSESLSMRRDLGQRDEVAVGLHNLGILEATRGNHSEAGRLFRESMTLSREVGNKALILESLAGMGTVRREKGDPTRAAQLLGASEALREETHVSDNEAGVGDRAAEHAALREALGDEPFERAWRAGRSMTAEAAIDLALSLGEQ